MADEKLCPLLKEPCKKEECPWWIDEDRAGETVELCAILSMALDLMSLLADGRIGWSI